MNITARHHNTVNKSQVQAPTKLAFALVILLGLVIGHVGVTAIQDKAHEDIVAKYGS